MNTVKIYQLNNLSQKQFQRCKAAKVWNACMETHKAAARMTKKALLYAMWGFVAGIALWAHALRVPS